MLIIRSKNSGKNSPNPSCILVYNFQVAKSINKSAFYLLLRILILAFFALTESLFFIVVTGITLLPVIFLTVVIRPYRQTIYNVIDIIFFMIIVQVFFSFAAISLNNLSIDNIKSLLILCLE